MGAPQKGESGGLSGSLPSFAAAHGLASLRLQGNSFAGPLPKLPAGIQEVRLIRQTSSETPSEATYPVRHRLRTQHPAGGIMQRAACSALRCGCLGALHARRVWSCVD